MREGRRIGIDVGDVRIGVATCDPQGLVATDLETVPAGPDALTRLTTLVREHAAIECIVGLPLSLSGREGPAARKVRRFAEQLDSAIDAVPVRLVDERMSTAEASGRLHDSGISSRQQRAIVDQMAARVILQTALDTERSSGHEPGWEVST